jgi:PAS domain S-box-containing protein
MGLVEDVTDRRRAEEALRSSEQQFHSVFTLSPLGIALTDLEGRVIDSNPTFQQMLGYAAEEILHQSFERFTHPEDVERERAMFRDGIARGIPFVRFQKRYVKKDGETIWVELTAGVHRDARGTPVFVIGIVQDITERRQAELALRDSETKYRTLFDADFDAMFLIDNATGRILEINSAAEALYGYSRDELLRLRNVDVSAQPDETRRHTEAATARVPLRFHRRKDGTVFPVEIAARHFTWHGRTVHLAAVRDITARRQTEAELRDLSHRLRRAQEEERRRIARDLHDSTAQKLAGLIMALGRLDEALEGAGPAERRLVADSLALVDDCVREVRSLSHRLHPPLLDELGLDAALDTYIQGFARRSGIAVTLDVPDDLRRPSSEIELALFRVAQESLGNVHRHAASPAASVRLIPEAGRLALEVRDQGRGIPPDRLDAIREGRPLPGMGIAGMRERIEQLGGTLAIESSPAGTTIRAVLPLSTATP